MSRRPREPCRNPHGQEGKGRLLRPRLLRGRPRCGNARGSWVVGTASIPTARNDARSAPRIGGGSLIQQGGPHRGSCRSQPHRRVGTWSQAPCMVRSMGHGNWRRLAGRAQAKNGGHGQGGREPPLRPPGAIPQVRMLHRLRSAQLDIGQQNCDARTRPGFIRHGWQLPQLWAEATPL